MAVFFFENRSSGMYNFLFAKKYELSLGFGEKLKKNLKRGKGRKGKGKRGKGKGKEA